MQSAATFDFNRLFYFAGRNRLRFLLNALANRHGLSSLPALPQVCGVETHGDMQQALADLSGTLYEAGYSLDDFVIPIRMSRGRSQGGSHALARGGLRKQFWAC